MISPPNQRPHVVCPACFRGNALIGFLDWFIPYVTLSWFEREGPWNRTHGSLGLFLFFRRKQWQRNCLSAICLLMRPPQTLRPSLDRLVWSRPSLSSRTSSLDNHEGLALSRWAATRKRRPRLSGLTAMTCRAVL